MAAKKTSTSWSKKPLYRSSDDRIVFGVLGGLAEYLDFNSTVLRLIYVALTAFTGFFPGIAAYIIATVIVPEK